MAYKCGNVPSDPAKANSQGQTSQKGRFSSSGRSKLTHSPLLRCAVQAETAKATESQEWCPRSPLSVGQSMWASQGLPCRCFSQDTSHVAQITAHGHENKDHFLLWEVSTLTGEKEELWNVTKDGDDELLMIRKETPQPQPCGGFPSSCQTKPPGKPVACLSPGGLNSPPRPMPGWLPLEILHRDMPGSASLVAEHQIQGGQAPASHRA